MGRTRKTAGDKPVGQRGGKSLHRTRRLELIKALIVDGWSDPEIVRAFSTAPGVPDPRVKDLVHLVGERQVALDLEALGEAWRALNDDPLVQEREVQGIKGRLLRIAKAAEDKGDWRSAIQANDRLLKIVGLRSERWRQRKDEAASASAAPLLTSEGAAVAAELARRVVQLTDAELVQRARELRERVPALSGPVAGAVIEGE